jgi:ribulose-phosphate 3-epimerase
MTEIIPAIMPKNYEDLKNKIAIVRKFVPVVQVDLCDGKYVSGFTWPFQGGGFDLNFTKILNEEEGMPFWEDVEFELDLMVLDAVENFDVYTKLGPKRIIFHLEAVGDLVEFKNFIEGIDPYIRDAIEFGIAVNPEDDVKKVFSLVNNFDFVQVMGIKQEGVQGEDFDEKCLGHVKTLQEKFPDLVIAVDGAVNMETAPALISAGASRLVIGSAIFGSDDVIGVIEGFKELNKTPNL